MNIFNLIYWEGAYIDLWSVDHFLSGLMFAFLPILFPRVSPMLGFAINAIILLFWEVGEFYVGVTEPLGNRLLDILIGIAGYILFFVFLRYHVKTKSAVHGIFLFMGLVTVLFSVLAWVAYANYSQ